MESEGVLTLEQLKCLASPARSQVFSTLRMIWPASAAEIAESLGRSAESIHFHLKQLQSSGLVEIAETRTTQRRPESVYRPTVERARLPQAPGTEPLVRKTVLAGLRLTERQFEAASKAGELDRAIKSDIQIIRGQYKLSDADLEKVMSMLEDAARYAKERDHPQGKPCSVTSLVCPIVKRTL